MDFKRAAEVFDRIEQRSGRIEMTKILAELFAEAGKDEIRYLVYLCQGALGPDFEKPNVGMAEKMITNAIARSSGFSKDKVEKEYKKKGDLGFVAEEFMEKKTQATLVSSKLTVKKVYDNFIKISRTEGEGSVELKTKLLSELFNSAKGVEARFICRIPLEALRLGIGDATIIDALALKFFDEARKTKKITESFELKEKKDEKRKEEEEKRLRMALHELIEAKFNIRPDLGEIAERLWEDGLKGLEKIKIEVGIPIRPTLAERLPSAKEIIEKLGKCQVEAKYDGLRIAVHKKGDKIILYSRRMEKVTEMFPDIAEAVKKYMDAESIIFEGEALTYNETTGEFYPFQITMQRKRKYEIEKKAEEFPLKMFAFDVVYLNGKNVMEKPLSERRKMLENVLKKNNTIIMTQELVTDSAEKLEKFFEENISEGLEGIIAKDLNAPYVAGARQFSWIKLKRSYKSQLEDTVDVVILGYYKGRGKRTEFGLGGLLTGIYDEEKNCFNTIARIGTGFTEAQLKEFKRMLEDIKVPKKPASVNSNIEADVWVQPRYVIEVNADEITRSPSHTAGGGLALRFPRIVRLREKKAEDATTEKEIISMFKHQKSRIEEEK